MKKTNDFLSKIFKGKKNSIISIVALVECVFIIVLSAYSWIESASSLVIKGDNLPINSNLNYRFDVKDGATNMVDLNTYFRPTALYQMAHASSPDGTNFYFKKANASTYRLGDTTDYNTSYYNFDFQIHNETAKTFNYYFKSSEIFDVTSSEITDENVLKAVEGAFRVAVTAGTNTQNTRVYSRDTVSYRPVVSKTGATTSSDFTTTGLSGSSEYTYATNTTNSISVFSTTGGGDDTKVNLKIWFEEKDPTYAATYAALSAENKKKLEGATVKINIQFVNSESNFQTFFFDDYTFSTAEGYEGKHVTSENQTMSLYFYYDDGNTTSVVPMTTTTSQGDAVRWVTADDSGEPTPRISDAMRKDLNDNPSHGYFFYGTYNTSTNSKTEHYKWPITKPAVNDGNVYIFKAMSVMKFNGVNTGYGVWDNTPIKLWYFKDYTTSATSDPYNANGAYFVDKAEYDCLYLSNSATASASATRMYHDVSTGMYKGYYLADVDSPVFSFTGSADFKDANIKVQWSADDPQEYDGKTIYKALGYEGTGVVTDQNKAAGVGTWMNVEQIFLSTELVDATMNENYRYKISADVNGTRRYYYMTKYHSALTQVAYVPVDSGNTTEKYVSFQRFADVDNDSNAGTWNSGAIARNGSNKFYATDMAATTSNGQWHIGVVVDGSADNIINDILTTVEGSKLEYSVDNGETYVAMNQLDDYRWYTNDFGADVTTLKYRWTAYTGTGYNEAVFTYGHDLADGIYFNITE